MSSAVAFAGATPGSAKKLALTAVVVSGALASVQSVSKGELPSIRIPLGMFVGGGLLLLLSELSPTIAAGLAAVWLLASVLGTAGPALKALRKGL